MSVRRFVSALGAASIALGCSFLVCTVSTAQDAVFPSVARLARAVVAAADPQSAPAPLPAATATAKPARRHRVQTTFAITGSASVSDRVQTGTTAASASSVSNLLGIEATFARRTDHATFTASLPASLAARDGTFGNLDAAYVAPTYALFYRTESFTPFGQLSVGSLPRSYGFATRIRGTDLELMLGSAIADGDRTFRFAGVRGKRTLKRGTAALGFLAGRAEDGGAFALTLLGGYATAPGKVDGVVEAALSRTRGLVNGRDAKAAGSFQARVNAGTALGYASYVERYLSPSFVGLGGGANQGDRYHGLSVHRVGVTSIDGELVRQETIGSADLTASAITRASLGLSRRMGRGTLSLDGSSQTERLGTDDDWVGAATAGYGTSIGRASFVTTQIGLQRERSTSNGSGQTLRLGGGLATTVLGTHVDLDLSTTNQLQDAAQQRNQTARLAFSRTLGGFMLGFTDAYSRVVGTKLDGMQNAAYVTIGRRLNASTSLQVQYGTQSAHDRYDPMPRHATSLFNISIGAPFTLGNGERIGHADPRLPASIAGSVVNSALPSTGLGDGGIAGITVVLDGVETRRTDFLGRFDFPFVTPGRHEISIDPAALPRGFTPDFPFLSVSVDGGQRAQAMLGISATAAIEGAIYAHAADGARLPVPNVGVQLDGGQRTDTGPNGSYGFGHLTPGKHTIALIGNTLPADFLISDGKRVVSTELGKITMVDFVSAPLGSIAGTIVAPDAIDDDIKRGPIANAYVVAEPGEHAAITDETGAFLIDDLPPGAYTVSVDEETLASNGAAASESQHVDLPAGAHVQGVAFTVSQKARDIDFSFKGAQAATLQVTMSRAIVPPGGAAEIAVNSSAKVDAVVADVFGRTFTLASRDGRHWSGEILAPLGTPNGPADVIVKSGSLAEHASLAVDAALPLASVALAPAHPGVGKYVTARVRFAAPAHEGDEIRWRDGQVTRLGKPIAGRVFGFTVKITELPFAGLLYCRGESVPISLIGR